MTYATKSEILGILSFFGTFDEADISTDIEKLCLADINAVLYQSSIPVPAADISNLLKSAEICFFMEHSSMVRLTEQAFGVIGEETIGEYTKKYENGMPMFFFAQGSNAPFLQLLPHETWRMRGYKYVSAFIKAYTQLYNNNQQYVSISYDNTSRGYGWDDAVSDWDGVG